MPHKDNPWLWERIKGWWKALHPLAMVAMGDQVSEHQRDLTGSLPHRSIEELFATSGSFAVDLRGGITGLRWDADRMQKNLAAAGEQVLSEAAKTLIALAGHSEPDDEARAALSEAKSSEQPLATILLNRLNPSEAAKFPTQIQDFTGLASERTRFVCARWNPLLHEIAVRTGHR
jgi:adenylosuccinate lyase